MELLKEQEKELTFASVISVLDGYVQGLTDDESKERGEKLLDIIGQYEKLDIIFARRRQRWTRSWKITTLSL